MTYRDAIYISTDSHVTEPIEIYGERVDAAFRGRVPRIETVGDWRTLLIEGLGPRKLMPASEREVAIVGDFDADDRFRDQLRDGVSAEVIFPTFALQACYASDDAEFQRQLCRAYNSWAIEVFDDHRLLPVGHGVDARHRRRDRRRQGRRRAGVPCALPSRAGADRACTTTAPTTRSGPSPRRSDCRSRSTPAPATSRVSCAGPGGAVINYLMGAQLDGPMVILTMAAGGALDRFPDLQVVTVETGASWLAWIMTQADAIYDDHTMYAKPKLSLKPSELIRRQCAATFMYDPVAINNRDDHRHRDADVGQRLPPPRGHVARVAVGQRRPVRRREPGRPRRHRQRQRRPRASASTSTSSRSCPSPSPRSPIRGPQMGTAVVRGHVRARRHRARHHLHRSPPTTPAATSIQPAHACSTCSGTSPSSRT